MDFIASYCSVKERTSKMNGQINCRFVFRFSKRMYFEFLWRSNKENRNDIVDTVSRDFSL